MQVVLDKDPLRKEMLAQPWLVMHVLPSWLPRVVHPLCTLCGRPKSSNFRDLAQAL